jgi:hypothetical protein
MDFVQALAAQSALLMVVRPAALLANWVDGSGFVVVHIGLGTEIVLHRDFLGGGSRYEAERAGMTDALDDDNSRYR